MSDLQPRLQTALGDAYRIDRELGGGGMSRVFLAHESALGRRVVVKVLPPEMAAGVNIERFRREIQLAASLQHPHIVPLHAAGQAGDLFYYTMPLVEGESLRAKMSREGELPVGDAIRILRDVVDALAYAHTHGVVHRDIKPDNILISGHHAVVTDFGVAKAVSASSGGSSLTSLGVALGTPAYMAPEQAAADPHVDHRADLYAVGAMAYEMLCGRPPFSGTPQQVLAAHVTLAPAALASQRASVPPALNALVMRCLEKKPADRVQHADDLLSQLQAMATPSGGMAPTGATPAVSSGVEAALRRAHPVRVTLLFALASLAVLAVVFLLRNKLGLPDWVFPWAIVLLAIGLPIMLKTGRMERARAQAQATGAFVPPPTGVARLFTWRKAILGGVLAFAALTIIVGGYTAMRLLGIGSVGTLQAKGLLKEKQPIILAEFVNRSSDSTLGPTLTEAFRVDLSQSQSVKLVDASVVGDALKRMNRPPTAALTPALAAEVAAREGVKAVVVGEIDPVGKSFVVSAKVISAADRAVLTAVRENAASDAELIPALDRLSRALRERIGESLVTIRADQPLAHVTTGSLDALRKYTQALRLANVGDDEGASNLLQEATAIDTDFAMAWRKLAASLSNMGASNEQYLDAATRAFKYRERLPELERQQATAYYYWTVDYDSPKVIAAYRAVLALDPDNDIALNNLAGELMTRKRYAEAESLAIRCTQLGSWGSCASIAIRAQVFQGKEALADSTLARFARESPHDPNVLSNRFALASMRGDYASADRHLRDLQRQQVSSPVWQQRTADDFAVLAGVQGSLALSEQRAREAAKIAESRGVAGDYLDHAANLAMFDVRYRGRPTDALAILASALAKHPLPTMRAVDRPYSGLARAYVAAGRVDEAQRLLSEYERSVPAGVIRGDPSRHAAAGDIALAQKRYADAIGAYASWREESDCPLCGIFEEAEVFKRAGETDSARVYLERYLMQGGPYRVFPDSYNLAATYQRLGEIYEAKGDRKQAATYYLKLTDLWKTADPELQPIVKDAHARIARLTAEH